MLIPIPRIIRIVSIIAHHKIMVFRNLKRSKIKVFWCFVQIRLFIFNTVNICLPVLDFQHVSRHTNDSFGIKAFVAITALKQNNVTALVGLTQNVRSHPNCETRCRKSRIMEVIRTNLKISQNTTKQMTGSAQLFTKSFIRCVRESTMLFSSKNVTSVNCY